MSCQISNGDVCKLSLIYNENYQYSLPQKVLESFLSGKAFDNSEAYTKEEAERLRKDINEIYQSIMAGKPDRTQLAIITAGAPGAGKTIKLRQDLEANRNGIEVLLIYALMMSV